MYKPRQIRCTRPTAPRKRNLCRHVLEQLEDRLLLRSDPGAEFVAHAYRDLLKRDAGVAEITAWMNFLNRGVPRSQVALFLADSPEARSEVAKGLYATLLHRTASPAEQNGVASFLPSGATAAQVKAILLGSPEYHQTRAGGSNRTFVSAVYQDALGRPPEPGAVTAIVSLLGQGASRTALALGVVNGPEGERHVVQGFYQKFLGRAADLGGLNAWAANLQGGVPDEQVIAAIVGSEEYLGRRPTTVAQNPGPPKPQSPAPPVLDLDLAFDSPPICTCAPRNTRSARTESRRSQGRCRRTWPTPIRLNSTPTKRWRQWRRR
jgi:hypothetical protein